LCRCPPHITDGERGRGEKQGRERGKRGGGKKIDCSRFVENPIVNSILQATPPTHSSETDRKIVT